MGLAQRADPPLRMLVILGSAMADIDYSGSDSLRQVHEELGHQGVTLAVADLSPALRKQLDAYGLTKALGAANVFASVQEAVAAHRAASAGDDAPASPS